jgi:hypothetical protein
MEGAFFYRFTKQSLRRRIPQYSNRRFSAGHAKPLMAVESFVGVTMAFTQRFYLLHLMIIFFDAGKKFQQPGFKQFIRLGCSGKKLPSSRA